MSVKEYKVRSEYTRTEMYLKYSWRTDLFIRQTIGETLTDQHKMLERCNNSVFMLSKNWRNLRDEELYNL
jgi:hypothetical protein